jgi:hypothetical protein
MGSLAPGSQINPSQPGPQQGPSQSGAGGGFWGEPDGNAIIGADDAGDNSWGDEPAGGGGVGGYLFNAGKQAVMGNYTSEGERNLAGTVGEIGVGFIPVVSTIASARDLTHDLTNWKWSLGHAVQTGGDLLGLIPFGRGIVKGARGTASALQGAADLGKGLGKVDGMIAKNLGKLDSAADLAKNATSLPDAAVGLRNAPKSGAQSPLLERYLSESGGRWGGTATRQLNDELATGLIDEGYTITGGAGRASEEFIRGVGPGTRGGTFVDITATNGTKTIRIQTIDTLADGITPTPAEAAAAARIRAAFPNDELRLIPKPK